MKCSRESAGLRLVFVIGLALCVFAAPIVCAAQSPSKRSVPTRQRRSQPVRPSASPIPKDATQELARRYQAAQAAIRGSDPQTVLDANKKLAALALRQLASLRLLEKAAPQAVEMLKESLALEDVPETRMALAIAALNADQADETLAQTSYLLQRDASNAHAWFLNGKAWMTKSDYRSAVEGLQHATQLTDDPNMRYALGLSLLKGGRKDEAQAVFQRMLDDYGDRAIWHVVFAGAYREADDKEAAVREFRRAIAMDDSVDHAHFFLGLTLLEQNHWAQTGASMAEFRTAVRLHPEDYSSNFFLGAGESALKILDSSNRHLNVAARIHPDVPEVWLFLGLNAYQQQDYAAAKKHLLQAIELTGSDEARNSYQLKRAYVVLSRIAFIEHDKAASEKYAERARDLQNKSLAVSAQSIADTMAEGGMGQAAAVMPHSDLRHEPAPPVEAIDVTASVSTSQLQPAQVREAKDLEKRLRQILSASFNDWGTSEARQGMFSFALEHFQEAEKWDNTTPGLMRNIELAASRLNNTTEALRALQEAVKINPSDHPSRARLAMMLYANSQYPDAVKHFNALGNAAFDDPGLTYAWAYSLVRTNDSKQAVVVLNHLSNSALPAEILVSVGDLYSALDFYEPAVSAYRKALQQNPDAARVHYKIGAALLRLDRAAEAATELETELKISPNDVDVQYNLSYALLQTSQKERALVLLRSVVTAHPDHPQAQYELGKTLLEEGHLEQALPHLEAAAKLEPASDYVHYQLQVVYRRLGRTADADNELKVYREIKARKREVSIPHSEPVNN